YNQRFEAYGLDRPSTLDPSIRRTDLIRRRWLDNQTWIGTWSMDWRPSNAHQFIWGGSAQTYTGDHFGEVIWSEFATVPIRTRWYEGVGEKQDANTYAKWVGQLTDRLESYVDLQVRVIGYQIGGTDQFRRNLDEDLNWTFFNPKAGLRYRLSDNTEFYGSFAVANREPVRRDLIDAPANLRPRHETL
ncbi:TonB-dependent receptor, partial [Arthrospira platensis SPKY1]|nr:TonB-dependent receptor [Arthrospira platensis SPKY1]